MSVVMKMRGVMKMKVVMKMRMAVALVASLCICFMTVRVRVFFSEGR